MEFVGVLGRKVEPGMGRQARSTTRKYYRSETFYARYRHMELHGWGGKSRSELSAVFRSEALTSPLSTIPSEAKGNPYKWSI